MKSNSYIFIDADYAYTSAQRNGQVPNYKNIMEKFKHDYGNSVVLVYHVGDERTKKGIVNFLFRLGIDFNIVFPYEHVLRPQISGAAMAIDSMRYYAESPDAEFVFLTGDDYMIPIVEELGKKRVAMKIFYFPAICSRALVGVANTWHVPVHELSKKYFTWPKR